MALLSHLFYISYSFLTVYKHKKAFIYAVFLLLLSIKYHVF